MHNLVLVLAIPSKDKDTFMVRLKKWRSQQILLLSQIYKGDPRTCAMFILAWGSNWGSSGFSRNQNNRGVSGASIHLHLLLRSERLHVTTSKTPHDTQRSWMHMCKLVRVWLAKTRRPQIWAPWLTTPLHRVVYKVWDLPCICDYYIKATFSAEMKYGIKILGFV